LSCWLAAALAAVVFGAAAPAGASVRRAPLGDAVLHYLPRGLGTSTDFEYHFARVSFDSRVWESGSAVAGWRVDLDIVVMHGAHMHTPQQLHDWFIRYEQRPPAEAQYRPVRVQHHCGWAARDQVFWLAHPGVAVSVRIDRSRWSRWELFHTARSVEVPVAARFGG
jgi:hypothetical protein